MCVFFCWWIDCFQLRAFYKPHGWSSGALPVLWESGALACLQALKGPIFPAEASHSSSIPPTLRSSYSQASCISQRLILTQPLARPDAHPSTHARTHSFTQVSAASPGRPRVLPRRPQVLPRPGQTRGKKRASLSKWRLPRTSSPQSRPRPTGSAHPEQAVPHFALLS